MSVNSYEFTARQWADFVGKLLIKGNWNQSALCRELNRVVPEKNQISASTVGNWVREEESGVEPSMPSIESMGLRVSGRLWLGEGLRVRLFIYPTFIPVLAVL